MRGPDRKRPPVAATTEGQPKTEEAIGSPISRGSNYDWQAKDCLGSESKVQFAPCRVEAVYGDPEGRIWHYSGKRARVLEMLASRPQGLTQMDTLPWHTRLGSSIHAMREDGLAISTELEGPYRHARYRLATDGCLIQQAKSRREAA